MVEQRGGRRTAKGGGVCGLPSWTRAIASAEATTIDTNYISLSIHQPTCGTAMRLEHRHLSLQPASIFHPRVQGTVLQSLRLRFKYDHRSIVIVVIKTLIHKGIIKAKKGL